MNIRALAVGLIVAMILGGCGGGAPQSFDLSAPKDVNARAARGSLAVNEPEATLPANSDRIVVRTGPEALAYLSGAQWVDRLPRLLQSRLIETFENAHLSRSIRRPGQAADFVLATEIRKFEIDVTSGQAVIEVSARIAAERSGRIVADRIFSARAPSPATGPAAMAAALNLALANLLREIVAWAERPD